MAELEEQLKSQIIESLNLEDIEITDIETDSALFGGGLGLDSIDALELIVMLEKFHGIKIDDPSQGKDIFKSVQTIADFIRAQKA
ncbi:MAG: acyl carrier protein [Flavobacteriales bacterium]|nr:acyl carrier protein [Flavobacteriales bacterium]